MRANRWKEPEIPCDLEAEAAVLGCVFIDPAMLGQVRSALRGGEFWQKKHRVIFEAMCEVADRGDTPDFLTVCDCLEAHGQVEMAGGAPYVTSLPNLVPNSAGAMQWARMLLKHSAKRVKLELAGAYGQASQRDDAEMAAEIEKLQARLVDIKSRIHSRQDATEGAPALLGKLLSDVKKENLHWLWHRYVALGKVATFDGDGGVGKSLATLDLAARVAMGREMPDGSPGLGAPAGVILICGEDGLADTVRPRLLAAGVSPEGEGRIRAINEMPELHADGSVSLRLFSLKTDLPALEATISAMGARLLVIDPVMAYLGDRVDAYKDSEVRRVLTPLAIMAERLQIAVVLIRHLNRSNGAPAQHRGLGSVAFLNVARLGILFAPNPDVEGEVLVSRYKGNIGAPPPTLAYRIVQVDEAESMPRLSWLGEREKSAEAALAAQTAQAADKGDRHSALEEAIDFLREELAGGPRTSDDVNGAAKELGIRDATLRRARRKLSLTPYREGGLGGNGRWLLPQIPRELGVAEDERLSNRKAREVPNVGQSDYDAQGSQDERLSTRLHRGEHLSVDAQNKPVGDYMPGSDLTKALNGEGMGALANEPEGWVDDDTLVIGEAS